MSVLYAILYSLPNHLGKKTHPQPLSFQKRGEVFYSPSLPKRRGWGMSYTNQNLRFRERVQIVDIPIMSMLLILIDGIGLVKLGEEAK
jgi:hypothetical protein